MKKWEGNLEMKRHVIASRVGRRLLSLLLSVVMIVGMIPAISIPVSASTTDLETFNSRLEMFKAERYSNGSKYVNNPTLTGGYECFGFANELAIYMFGSYPTNSMSASSVNNGWTRVYGGSAVDSLCVGDVVRYGFHSIFITSVSGNNIYYCQANIPYGTNKVTYDNYISRSDLKALVSKKLTSANTDKTGWVAHFQNGIAPSAPAPIPTPNHNCGSCVSMSKTGSILAAVNIRTGPSTSNTQIGEFAAGTSVSITAKCGNWYLVSSGSTSGWANGNYIEVKNNSNTGHECSNCVSVSKSGTVEAAVNVRNGPGTGYDYLFEYATGTDLAITKECNGWYFVSDAGGSSGWVAGNYVNVDTHTHSYSIWNYEAAHPHLEYMSCSCGAYKYTDENYFNKAYFIGYYAVHPHYEVKVCNICGWDEVEETGGTRYVDSCTTCNPPHEHSYTTLHDGSHPHREFKKCACGDWYYLDSYYYDSDCMTCNPPKYTISFDANGGNWSGGTLTKTHDVNVTIPDTYPTRTGYTFRGWSTSRNGTIAYFGGETYTANSSITLYAVWKANTYTVTYNSNGGSGTMAASSHTYDTAKALTPNAFTRTGYTFTGWSTSSSATSAMYTDKQSIKNLTSENGGTVNLYAVWSENPKYTVSYDANGGTGAPANQTKTKDVALTLSSTEPTKTGYEFKGWATSSDGSVDYASGATYSSNSAVTLYAVWEANKYTVTYNANGGTGTMAASQHIYGTEKALTANEFTKDGYTFRGWATGASGTVAYTDGQSIKNLSSTNGGNVTLYALWGQAVTGITLNHSERRIYVGSGFLLSHRIIPSGAFNQKVIWRSSDDKIATVNENGIVTGISIGTAIITVETVEGGFTAECVFSVTEKEYTVLYDGNGGTVIYRYQQKVHDVDLQLREEIPTKEGYTFTKWIATDGTEYNPGDVYTANEATTLTAQWIPTPKTITIKYDANGGTGSPCDQTKTEGQSITLSETTPTKTGYKFVNWKASDGTLYNPNDTYSADSNTILVAQWSAITYKVKFDANGGEGSMGYNLCRYDSENSLDPNEFERDGYEFVGWALSPDATQPQFADREKVLNLAAVDGAIVLIYAVWEKVETYEIEIWIANEEEIDEVVLNLQAGEIIDLGEYKPKQTGYTFIAWWDFYADKSYSPNDKFVVSKDTLLVSGMQANTYIVDFDAQGGTVTEDLKSIKFDSAYGALPAPTRNGYDFDGWYTEPTGGEVVTAETIVSTPDRHTLYARWRQKVQIISPVSVTLDKTSVSLQVGGTATLSATIAPGNATNKSVTWTSTNETVATVSNGVVTAHAAGTATITVTTVDGAKTATCLVTVEEQNASYDAYVYTEAKKSAVQGSQFTFKVSLAGTYDGYSFALIPADGLSIVNIAAAGSGIYIDEQADRWLISVLGGLGKSEAEKEEIITVTVQVDADAQLGVRELNLSNVMISNDLGDKVSSVRYEYASIEITDKIPGDINGDEVFDYYDVSKLFAFYRNKTTLDESIDTDINGDGTFDYYDVSKLFAIYRGKATFN